MGLLLRTQRFQGWILMEVQNNTLRWEKNGVEVKWTRIGIQPEYACIHLPLPDNMGDPDAKKAFALLRRNYAIADSMRDDPDADLFGLEFSHSMEGIFAACIILRDPYGAVNMIPYLATRVPVQGLGVEKILVDEVQEKAVFDNCFRWIALVPPASSHEGQWWSGKFKKDVTEEMCGLMPFENCLAFEDVEEEKCEKNCWASSNDKRRKYRG
eukprot:GEMP01031464.1.p1 GENE.GEMP01031464.1~~GEMP01031464.1.p1  ORF type:complete len:212 (+),score=40.10 GEMP01031464.1:463-1098(+)